MDGIVVIGSFLVWQSLHSPNRSPPDVSFRHIQDLVYFVGAMTQKKDIFRDFCWQISSVYYGTADPRRRLRRTAREVC